MEHWYAIQVRPQREISVLEALVRRAVLVFWPNYREKRGQRYVRRSLFPGYLFARLDLNDRNHPAVSVPNVVRIVGTAEGPIPIPDVEIEAVQLLSKCPTTRPEDVTDLRLGEAVRVISGALKGMVGRVVSLKNSTRIYVLIDLLGQATSAEIDIDAVEPLRQVAA